MINMDLEGIRKLQSVAESDKEWSDAVEAYVQAIVETGDKFVKRDGEIVKNEAIDWDD